MLTLNKQDKEGNKNLPVIELYDKSLFNYDHKLEKDAQPSEILYLDKSNNDELIINDLQNKIPMPYIDNKQRFTAFLNGASHSFKSSNAGSLISIFMRKMPRLYIIYITGITLDEPLSEYFKYLTKDDKDKNRIMIITPQTFIDIINNNKKNKTKLKIPLSVKEINEIQNKDNRPYLIIFDDIDNIQNNTIRNLLLNFSADCLNTGRSHNKRNDNIHVINISHNITATTKNTRLYLRESTYTGFNLQAQSKNHIKNLLSVKYGADDEFVDEILKQKKQGAGWTWASSSYPYLIMNDKAIFIS
ncbi:MAG: hypothetical protein IIZ40_03970 [Bacilli bacterium]|nr:hypothetical protein [Bacilli bacterium]